MLEFKISGGEALARRLLDLDEVVRKKVAFKGVLKAASIVKKAARQRAPVSSKPHLVADNATDYVEVQPGNLRLKIVTRKNKRTRYTAEYQVTVKGRRQDGYAARYGRLVEYGTINMVPRPFMRPALFNNAGACVEAMRGWIERGVTKAEGA